MENSFAVLHILHLSVKKSQRLKEIGGDQFLSDTAGQMECFFLPLYPFFHSAS